MPSDHDELRDLTDGGSPVKSRISDPLHAKSIADDLAGSDSVRAERRSKVQGLIDGNPVMSRRTMIKDGRSGDSNMNWRESNGHLTNAWVPYHDLRGEVPVCIDGDLEYGDPSQDAELMRGFGGFFHKMQFGWAGFDRVTQLCDKTMLVHGVGNKIWDDEWDWRSKSALVDDLIVPDDAFSDLSNAEEVLIKSISSSGALWRMIENERQAKAAGWNPESVKKCIMRSRRDSSTLTGNDWGVWQRSFKNGDRFVSRKQTKQIPLHTLLVQEMDASISQHIMDAGDSGGKPEYLYSKVSRYEGWEQCVCPFPYDIGSDGTWYSIKGLGTELYPFGHLSNRVLNNLADMMIVGIKPWFEQTTGGEAQKLKLMKMAGFNIMPAGYKLMPVTISGNIAPALEVSREFKSILGRNTGSFQPQDISPPTVEETAKSATIRAMDRAKITKGSHNRYCRHMDREYSETWRRAINPKLRPYHPGAREALRFQEECRQLCVKMGVPWEKSLPAEESPTGKAGTFTVLECVRNVRATRSLGLGDPATRVSTAAAFLDPNFMDRLDPVSQNTALRMYASAVAGQHIADAVVPSISTGQMPVDDDAVAAAENNSINALGEEAELVITPRQQHEIHLNHHVASAEKDQQACESGEQDPRQCFMRLEVKGMHSHEHLAALERNPMKKPQIAAFGERLRLLAGYSDHLRQNIEEEDAANPQEEPGNPSPEMVKVQGDLALKAEKQQATIALKAQNQQHGQALKTQDLIVKNRLADLDTAAKIRRDTAAARAALKNKKPKDNGK